MTETGTMSLTLKIAGDGHDDFYPHELTLDEGISRVYRATLTVFTKTARKQKELRELLERRISLVVSQRLAGGVAMRNRYVHGIITGIANLGVVSRGEGAPCFRHVITIENELAKLRHTNLNCPWYGKTPPEIIGEMLSRYGIRGEFSDRYINRNNFTKNLLLEQTATSDLDFIRRIMALYGISWAFIHGKVSRNGLGVAEFYFSEGWRFPHPIYDYSDNREIPEIEYFDFQDFADKQNAWSINDWCMESSMGVDGFEVTAHYPQANHGSREWNWGETGYGKRYHNYGSLFHGYQRETPLEEIDADIKRIIEARRAAFVMAKESCKGETENVMPMPGLILEVGHFYGKGDSGTVPALVTDSKLHVRAKWPRNIVALPIGGEPGEMARVEFTAKLWGKDSEKRFVVSDCSSNDRGKRWN